MKIPRYAAAVLLLVFLPACTMMGGGKDAFFDGGTTYYLDSNLGFSWAYPESWERLPEPRGSTVRWNAPLPDDPEEAIRVAVRVLPPTEAAGGYPALMKAFTLSRPNFTLTAERDIELDDGTPALEILGHTPGRSFLVSFVTSRRGAFILSFSIPPGQFNRFLPFFRETTASFRVLD